jgi:hypothetical protein
MAGTRYSVLLFCEQIAREEKLWVSLSARYHNGEFSVCGISNGTDKGEDSDNITNHLLNLSFTLVMGAWDSVVAKALRY